MFKFGYGLAYTILNAQFLAFIGIVITSRSFQKHQNTYIPYLILYIIYFFFDSVIQSISFLTKWNEYKMPIILIMWATMLLDDIKKGSVSVLKLRRSFITIIIFEIVLGGLQYMITPIGNFFRNVQYVRYGELTEIPDVLETGYMVGTLGGSSTYANFIASSFIILILYYFNRVKMEIKNWILLASMIASILFSGIRSPFLIIIIVGVIAIIKYQRHLVRPLCIVCASLFIIKGGIQLGAIDNLRRVGFEEGGLFRTFTLFSFNTNSLVEESTIALTICMIPYMLANPLIGIGLHHKGGYVLEMWNETLETFSTTDAQLAFMIAEIGIIGVIVYLLPFYNYIKEVKKLHFATFNYNLYFASLIIMTIVDSGIMDTFQLLLFFYSVVFWVDPLPIEWNKNNKYKGQSAIKSVYSQ